MTNKVLKFLLLASPICYLPNISLVRWDISFFHIGVMLLFIASMFDKPVREFPYKASAILLGISILNVMMRNYDVICMNKLINTFLFIFAISTIVRFCKDYKSCYKFIAYAVVINLIIFISQLMGFNPILDNIDLGGIMGNAPRLMSYLVITFPIVVSFTGSYILIILLCSIFTKEKSALAIIPMFTILWNKVITLILVSMGIIYAVIFRGTGIITSISHRLVTWKEAISIFFSNPMFGLGIGHNSIKPMDNFFISNDYIEFVLGIGILGLLWLGYILHYTIKNLDRTIESQSIVALLLLCFIEYPFEIQRLWITIAFIIGAFVIKNIEKRGVESLNPSVL